MSNNIKINPDDLEEIIKLSNELKDYIDNFVELVINNEENIEFPEEDVEDEQ